MSLEDKYPPILYLCADMILQPLWARVKDNKYPETDGKCHKPVTQLGNICDYCIDRNRQEIEKRSK